MFYRKPFVFINKHLNLHLEIVGGAALLFNGITGYETADIDTIIRISDAVQEIIDDYCIDINNDACDYIDDYDDCYWLEETSYSNISISYLSLGSAIKTKIKYIENPYIYR